MADEYIKKNDVLDLLHTFPAMMAIESITRLRGLIIEPGDKPTIVLPKEPLDKPYIPHGGEEYTRGYEHGWRDCINRIGV